MAYERSEAKDTAAASCFYTYGAHLLLSCAPGELVCPLQPAAVASLPAFADA